MLTLQIPDELESQFLALVAQEHTTPEQFIGKPINQCRACFITNR